MGSPKGLDYEWPHPAFRFPVYAPRLGPQTTPHMELPYA